MQTAHKSLGMGKTNCSVLAKSNNNFVAYLNKEKIIANTLGTGYCILFTPSIPMFEKWDISNL